MPIPGKRTSWISSVTLTAAAIAMTIVIALTMLGAQIAQAQTFSVIHAFTGGSDGKIPEAGLTLDAGGNLYGTASAGGTGSSGTVYKLTHKGTGWTINPLYSFAGGNDGAMPTARVILGPNGTLYGTTIYGGAYNAGTVFKVTRTGAVKVVYSFGSSGANDGVEPFASLINLGGTLYGTTAGGGANSWGTVFAVTP